MTDEQAAWGRVDEDGTVSVREGEGWRVVGQYPDAEPAEALAYYERKYSDLAGQLGLLEQRARRGTSAAELAPAVARLRGALTDAAAVGDLGALRERLDRLGGTVDELGEKQSAASAEALAAAVAEREAIVQEAERLAATDPARIQWKSAAPQMDSLFSRWQNHQQSGPRLPKREQAELWRRFRAARQTLDAGRRAHFAQLDETHREAKGRKERLVERAEALAPKGTAGIPDYRALLDEWKRSGRAGRKADDALWGCFSAAGDVLYAAKAEAQAKDDEEFRGNLERKLELLTEAETILGERDRTAARQRLIAVQRRWEEIGKVPRDRVRSVEDRLRAVETHVRRLDDEHWKRSDPEKQARSEGLAAQVTAAIARHERELEEAAAAGDARRVRQAEEALETQRGWLKALGV